MPPSDDAEVVHQRFGVPNGVSQLREIEHLHGSRLRVAEHLGVCNATVYRLRDSGELPHVWVVNSIRIRPHDLETFILSRR